MIEFATSKCQAGFARAMRTYPEFRAKFFSWYVLHLPEFQHDFDLDPTTLETKIVKENWNPPTNMVKIAVSCHDFDEKTHCPREISWEYYRVPCDKYGLQEAEPAFVMNGAWIHHIDGGWSCHT